MDSSSVSSYDIYPSNALPTTVYQPKYTKSNDLKQIDIHDDEKSRTYKCPYSSRRFNSRSNMIKHIKMNAERIEIDGEHLTAALTAEIMKRPKLGFVAPSSAKNSSKGGESSSGWNCDLSLIYCTKDHDKENYSMRDL